MSISLPNNSNYQIYLSDLMFIYSEKTTKFFENSTVDLSYVVTVESTAGGDFAKFCGLLRIYGLYRYFLRFEFFTNQIY